MKINGGLNIMTIKRNSKLTLADIIAKKQAKATQTIKVEDVYVKSMGGEITVTSPSRGLIYQYVDRLNDAKNGGAEEVFLAHSFLISQCVSEFKDKEFYAEEGSPELAVHKLLELEDINNLVTKINNMSGSQEHEVEVVSEIKN
jgi:hypothetical protein